MSYNRAYSRSGPRRMKAIKKGNWAGSAVEMLPNFLSGTTIYEMALWSPFDSSELNVVGLASPKRIVGNITIRANGGSTMIGAYIHVFPTDEANLVPGAVVWNPLDVDPDVLEKRSLWTWMGRCPTSVTASTDVVFNIPIDLKPRGHKFSNEDQLSLVIVGNGGTSTLNTYAHRIRTYCQW